MNTMNRNTKKVFGLVIVLLLALMTLHLVSAASAVRISVSKYEPYPATPGQLVKVWFLVTNDGDTAANDVILEAMPEYPFTMYSGSNVKDIGFIGPQSEYLVDFTFKIDENAVQGNNILKMKYKEASLANAIEQTVDAAIFVQNQDATLSIDSVHIEPAEIMPGSDGTITITVRNTAQSTFTNINLKLYLQSVVGSTVVDLPFAPVDSSAEKKIFKLAPGQTDDFTFRIRAYPDAASKIYKIPFILNYYDSLGNLKNKSDVIGVVVNSKPDIAIIIDKTDMSMQKRAGTISFKIINKGLSDVKFVNAILKDTADYDILSNSATVYVGNLASDDYQSVEYQIIMNTEKNTVQFPITVQYRDANNKQYETTEDIAFNVIDSSKLKDAQSSGSKITMTVIIVIILIIGGFIYFRSRAKKNKKAQFN